MRIIELDRNELGDLRDPLTGEAIVLVLNVRGERRELPTIYFPGDAQWTETYDYTQREPDSERDEGQNCDGTR